MDTQTNSHELQEKIKGYINNLANETDLARRSEAMQKYLEFVAKFHQYSLSNIWLILIARPDATQVAGFLSWKRLNRFVKKGEKGIPIFAPLIHKDNPESNNSPKVLFGFRIVYVFDVLQTDGEPLPPAPNWKSPEKSQELNEKLIIFAKNKGLNVLVKKQKGDIQGVSKGGEIEIDPSAGTKTLVHEISHELLHREEIVRHSYVMRELEAESVAYVVCSYFGFTNLASPNYLALHDSQGELIIARFQRISNLASDLILAIEGSCK